MILVNLLETGEANAVDRARRFVLFAFPFFVALVVAATWPYQPVAEVRLATPEEKETVVESLGRLPGYYQQLEKISASIVDELVFERTKLQVRDQAAPLAEIHEDTMTVSESFFETDPRSQAQALSTAIAPHNQLKAKATDIAIVGE